MVYLVDERVKGVTHVVYFKKIELKWGSCYKVFYTEYIREHRIKDAGRFH